MKKFTLLVGVGIGFIAGSWAGRRPYETIEATLKGVVKDPDVQKTLSSATESAAAARDAAHDAAVDVIEDASTRIANGAEKVASK